MSRTVQETPREGWPAEPEGNVTLCHTCSVWQRNEIVTTTEGGAPVCQECAPHLFPAAKETR